MIVHYFIQYRTTYGQSLHLMLRVSKTDTDPIRVPLQFYNDEFWSGIVDVSAFDHDGPLWYTVHLANNEWEEGEPVTILKKLEMPASKKKQVNIYEQLIQQHDLADVYESKAFDILLNKPFPKKYKPHSDKHPTHRFKVYAPVMDSRYVVCISGSGHTFHDWDTGKPILLEKKKKYWTASVKCHKDDQPLEFKLGIYDLVTKSIASLEPGANRSLPVVPDKDVQAILILNAGFPQFDWKGAGVNFPVSSLRTAHSWGIGDFTDLDMLTDFAESTGMKLIQLLPVNDTTTTHTNKDSYPYAAISPFALHPLYLNIQKLATAHGVEFDESVYQTVDRLNSSATLDYEGVAKLKMETIRAVYRKDGGQFKDDFAYIEFFDMNRHWLVPYAVFSALRDKYKTADFSKWEDMAVYDEATVQEYAAPDTGHYDEICIHYFIQYHLHLQLTDAVEYAHKKCIVFKGDLPIGVGRYSVDTWMYPHLFHMDMQAGAPPDYYSTKGQNWNFPTYNWEAMSEDNYQWWRQRMEHLGNYFDAIRIDHVLGFFRIWSIPVSAIEGTLGVFHPALGMNAEVFTNHHVPFDHHRLASPYITDDILRHNFGSDEQWVRDTFLDGLNFKTEFNTQQNIAAYFIANPDKKYLEEKLFRLLSEIILQQDASKPGVYHFRINMHQTESYQALPDHTRTQLDYLYDKYFFQMQNSLWEADGIRKIQALRSTTDMLLCAEDLGMVPEFMEEVLNRMKILSLQVQRMPKQASERFASLRDASYLSVVTPSTHDMTTIRQWWEDERDDIPYFYNNILGHEGNPPLTCEPWISSEIIEQHLYSPAMWAVFLLQDLLGMHPDLATPYPSSERVNDPSNPNHDWNYRMHIPMETLIAHEEFTDTLQRHIANSNR